MAGVKLEYYANTVQAAVSRTISQLEKPAPLFAIINEYLLQIHRQRFKDQISPAGVPWAPLSPRYQKRKHRNANKILTLRGYLQGTLRGQWDADSLEFGTDRIYGAVHHLGAEIKKRMRSAQVYFRQYKDGSVGNRFAKKHRSNFAQDVTVKEHSVKIPAREWLGTSTEQDQVILDKTLKYLEGAVSR